MTDSPEHSLHCACVPPSEIHSEAEAETAAVEVAADADVQIAQIEADTAVTLAKLDVKASESHDETEVEALKAEIRGMKETLALAGLGGSVDPAPEASEPAPVIVPVPEPESAPDSLPAPEAHDSTPDNERPSKTRSHGFGSW
jgi:hypothetical protein